MAEATGLVAALGEAAKAAPAEAVEQLDWLATLPLIEVDTTQGRKGPGRPKGSMNKSTKELAEYVLARHRHPVIAAAQLCDIPIQMLASELRCDRIDAAKFQQQLREFVAKYTVQAMPQSVNVNLGIDGELLIVNLNSQATPGAARSPFAIDAEVIEQNQTLSSDELSKSHDEKSHDTQSPNLNKDLDWNNR